jgi:hypothetical protein
MSTTYSINHNTDPTKRVRLEIKADDKGGYYIETDSREDCGPHFETIDDAENAIYQMYGRSIDWGLEVHTDEG